VQERYYLLMYLRLCRVDGWSGPRDVSQMRSARSCSSSDIQIFLVLGNHLEAAKAFNTLGLILDQCGAINAAEDAGRQAIEISRQCRSLYEEARALPG
jgi:hypothetical protein